MKAPASENLIGRGDLSPADARSTEAAAAPPEQSLNSCPHPGCSAPRNSVQYLAADGRRWCINHCPDRSAHEAATRRGGASKRKRETRVMPKGSAAPDWSTPPAIREWAQDRAGRIERGELDQRNVPHELAKLAKATHDTEELAKLNNRLDQLESALRDRRGGGGIIEGETVPLGVLPAGNGHVVPS